jgi:hypothetical protein
VNTKTPGQVNYEAFTAVRYNGSLTTAWTSPAIAHKAWESAAAAVLAPVAAERDRLRALAEELYAALVIGGQDSGDVRRSALGILQRAGIGWQPPAVETAGTEHLAAQIMEARSADAIAYDDETEGGR